MGRFTSFVVLAEMRTGSNALEERINLFEGLTCYGEVFNPSFLGHQGQTEILGVDMAARERDPLALLAAMKRGTQGCPGFRIFHDHDPRVLAAILPDPTCAKVMLTRDPVESYVSLKIARATGQWQLTDAADRKRARIRFDPEEFETLHSRHRAFRARVLRVLQETGQAAFPIEYTRIDDLGVLNGLARFLGVDQRIERVRARLKRQNPEPLSENLVNPEVLATIHRPWEGATDPDEPSRGAALGLWSAAPRTPLLHVGLKGGAIEPVEAWLSGLDSGPVEALRRGFTRQTLRQWQNRNKDGRSFAVVCHPVERAHRVFCRHILGTGSGTFTRIRAALRSRYEVPLPEGPPDRSWEPRAHREAFLGFLRFAKANLAGQTGLRTDPAWNSQSALLSAISQVLVPDLVLREADLSEELPRLAERFGHRTAPALTPSPEPGPVPLTDVYDDAVEEAVRDLHNRDYRAFGFRPWLTVRARRAECVRNRLDIAGQAMR